VKPVEKPSKRSENKINDQITAEKVRLIDQNGVQAGIVELSKALKSAKDAEMDLVQIVDNAKPPVVKILNYSKFRYEKTHKARSQKRNQTNTEVKEIRFRLKIESHDYEIKLKKVIRFLETGDKVKVGIMFRGRELAHPERGAALLQQIADKAKDIATIETPPVPEGRNMSMVLAPLAKKLASVSQQRRSGDLKKLNRQERIARRAKRKESNAKE
jgi:translation initiation factor IF-3